MVNEKSQQPGSISILIEQLKHGNDEAATEFWQRYFSMLVSVAQKKINSRARRVSDEQDVASEVFYELCERSRNGNLDSMKCRSDLWKLLLVMTQNKVIDHARANNCQKRGNGKVSGDSIFVNSGSNSASSGWDNFCGNIPTPYELSVMQEQMNQLINLLSDEKQREIAKLRLLGHSDEEIADIMGISKRTVIRKKQLIQNEWSKHIEI